MKITLTSILLMLCTLLVQGQELYSKSFGNKDDQAVIFLHGGPGYNCANFESTSAQELADKGFFVIVYDRRGEGRSKDANAQFSFNEAFEDLNTIYQEYGFNKASFIGHSFGGMLAIKYAKLYPQNVEAIILVGAPVSLQVSFKNIISRSKQIYLDKNDEVNLKYISFLETMDTSSIEYSSYCFAHAMQNGFYNPSKPSKEAIGIYTKFRDDTLLVQHSMRMTYEAPKGFMKNEKYTCIDLSKDIEGLLNKGTKIYGLYGKDDGLYSVQQIEDLKGLIGADNLLYFDHCSHSVFIDQQTQFMGALEKWILVMK